MEVLRLQGDSQEVMEVSDQKQSQSLAFSQAAAVWVAHIMLGLLFIAAGA